MSEALKRIMHELYAAQNIHFNQNYNFDIIQDVELSIMDRYYVYFLWDSGIIVKVGYSDNLYHRIGTHVINKRKGRLFFNAITYREYPDKILALREEEKYIYQLKPKYNQAEIDSKNRGALFFKDVNISASNTALLNLLTNKDA